MWFKGKIFSKGLRETVDTVADTIDRFVMSKEEKAKIVESIISKELNQDDKFTKRARPTVIYMGLVFILMELLGLRMLALGLMGAPMEIIDASNSVFKTFLTAWGGIVSMYAIGRSLEKKNKK